MTGVAGRSPAPVVDVSIVIVSWNTQQMTRACLESVYANLGLLRAEVIVVDNGSEDGSAEMIPAEFPQALFVQNTENVGFACANNAGFERAHGRHVLLLNSDTIVIGDTISRSVAFLDTNPEVGVLGCRVLNTDRTLQRTCFMQPTLLNVFLKSTGLFHLPGGFFGREHYRGWLRDSRRDVGVVTGCYMLVRGAAMEGVGALDGSFFFCGEETDWCRRFRTAGWRVVCTPEAGQIVHHGNGSGRRMSFRRDLWLSQGLVRYHRKHNGFLCGVLCWLLLLWFNVSHALGWSLFSLCKRTQVARDRRGHFWNITRRFVAAWAQPVEPGGGSKGRSS